MRQLCTILTLILTLSPCFGQQENRADSFFYAANNRQKTNVEHGDSTDILQSILDYSEAIKLNPKFWQAYRNRSRLYRQTKEFDKAVRDLTTALNYADGNSALNLHDMRAYSYYDLCEYDKAISDWTIAADNLGNPALALLQRAKAEWKVGQKEKSCTDYKKALELDNSLATKKEFIQCE